MGRNIFKSVKAHVMKSENEQIFWKTIIPDGAESFVGVGQLYSDKAAVSLKSNGFRFYPIHITLLNFEDELTRKLISSGATIFGYLPVSYDLEDNSMRKSGDEEFRRKSLETLHIAINKILEPFAVVAEKGFECVDGQGVLRLCHFAIGSYCADIPEIKDLTGVKNGNSTVSTCFRCLSPTELMNQCTSAEKRTLHETLNIISQSDKLNDEAIELRGSEEGKKKREQAKQQLMRKSLIGVLPAFHSFPFVSSCDDLDIFQIYLFELLHKVFLGISKMLKQVFSERISDPFRKSSFLKNSKGQPKSFPSVRAIVLSVANEIMQKRSQEQPMRGLRIDHSKSAKPWKYNGSFTKDGILGMLEGKDLQALDMIFPFTGAFIDTVYGEDETCFVTTVFTAYSEIILLISRRNMPSGWKQKE